MEEFFNQILHQVVSIVVGGVCAYFGAQLKQKQAELEQKEQLARLGRKADIVTLRNTIRQACKKAIKRGWVALDEKSDILACYDVYEEIITQEGLSNGVIDDIVTQFRHLPNVEPVSKE